MRSLDISSISTATAPTAKSTNNMAFLKKRDEEVFISGPSTLKVNKIGDG